MTWTRSTGAWITASPTTASCSCANLSITSGAAFRCYSRNARRTTASASGPRIAVPGPWATIRRSVRHSSNEVRLGYMRRRYQAVHPSQNQNWAAKIGIPDTGLTNFGWAFPRFNIDNVEALGPSTGSVAIDQVEENYQLTENYTKIRGHHTFKAGYFTEHIKLS